jgi:hypothetical protein
MAEESSRLSKDSEAEERLPEAVQHKLPEDVRFVGVVGHDPRFQVTNVPVDYQSHLLVKNRFFYTIPTQLLELVCQRQTGESFDVDIELLKMEFELSRISGDHGTRVGFWINAPITCNLMHATPLRREDLELFGKLREEQISEIIRAANERLLSFAEISCGYAGWLMTNRDFQSELDGLVSRYDDQMHRWGTALVGIPVPSFIPAGNLNPTDEEGWKDYDSGILEFCIRWRLQGLAGPRIPIPMRPMMSGQFPLSVVPQLMRAGGVFNWPDTFPLFARDELRDLLASALQPRPSQSTEHLDGWRSIVAASNRAKNQIPALERRFRLQHFWRLLRERHPLAFPGRLARIEEAFAEYFGMDNSTIKLDRRTITKSLGADWDQPKGGT